MSTRLLALGVRDSVAMGLALPVGGHTSLVLGSEARTSSFPPTSHHLALLTTTFPVIWALGGAMSPLTRVVGFDDVGVPLVVVVGLLGVVEGGVGLVMGGVGCWDPLGWRKVGVRVRTCSGTSFPLFLTVRFAPAAVWIGVGATSPLIELVVGLGATPGSIGVGVGHGDVVGAKRQRQR